MELFEYGAKKAADAARPLAERMRPRRLDDFLGQRRAVGEGSMLRNAVERDKPFSMILWGPPGCGKTTLAGIIAAETRSHFVQFSAVLSGVKEIRAVIEEAKKQLQFHQQRTILFVDEIHRFNKAQQDSFLHHVENGLITLLGATTENPSFEVIPPLLSRCRVITLEPLSAGDVAGILDRALRDPEQGLGKLEVSFTDEALAYIIQVSGGDARIALNSLEIAAALVAPQVRAGGAAEAEIGLSAVEKILQEKVLLHDKAGESHYNLISAFHKSLRGSDPDAAIYWLDRMLQGGEDPFYIARRMVRFASEDIGNADPQALALAMDAMEAFRFLGHPEGELALAQAAVYLATAPKSNRVYAAFESAHEAVKEGGALPVPLHIRNAPTRLMKELGYGKGYKYAHDHHGAYVFQTYLPEGLKDRRFYFPSDRGYEQRIKERLEKWYRLGKEKQDKDR